MKKVIAQPSVLIILFFINLFLPSLYCETIRDRATVHFNMIDWITRSDSRSTIEIPGSAIPGGNETFAVLGSVSVDGSVTIYPEMEKLGTLDYSGCDTDLLSLLQTISSGLKENTISASLCNPERPFISSISTYQAQKLPSVTDVFYSRPIAIEEGGWSTRFRMHFLHNGVSSFVYVSVITDRIQDAWKINEIFFDGETYARVAQSN